MISFGGWALFQDLLRCLRAVADRHNVAIANVAVRWTLDRPQVGGVIIGARLGIADHIEENKRYYPGRPPANPPASTALTMVSRAGRRGPILRGQHARAAAGRPRSC